MLPENDPQNEESESVHEDGNNCVRTHGAVQSYYTSARGVSFGSWEHHVARNPAVHAIAGLPLLSETAGSAPILRSRDTTWSKLNLEAQCRGVSLEASLALTSAPYSTKRRTISSTPVCTPEND